MRILALMIGAIAVPAAATEFSVVHMTSSGDTRYLHVQSADLDGDGSPDMSVVRLTCDRGAVSSASVYAPRDAATGMSSGKRMHKPFTIVKEWGAAPPGLSERKGNWDLATMKGGRTMAMDDWHQASVSGVDAACASTKPVGKVSVSDLSFTK